MKNRYELKIVIIGDRESGRTSLACLLANQPYKAREEGIEIYNRTLTHKNKKILLNIWDFSSKEILFATHSLFLTSRTLYLLVDDTRKDDSNLEDESFKYWFDIIKNYANGSPLLIVQNEKGGRSKQINLPGIQHTYPFVHEVCRTDLLTGSGTETVFNGIITYGVPIAYQNVNYSWLKVIESLKIHSKNFDYIRQEDFKEICKKRGVQNSMVNPLIDYLNNLGYIISYQSNPYLKDWIVLNGDWMIKSIYSILESKRISNQCGYFIKNDVEEILYASEYKNKFYFIIEVMRKFLLCYQVDDKAWIAPQLIKIESPDLDGWRDSNKKVVLAEYPFLPRGFIGQLLVKIVNKIELRDAWQTGLIFDYKGSRCLIRERWADKKIEIKSSSKNEVIRFCYENLKDLSNLHRVSFDYLLPCNCEKCLYAATPVLYSYEELLTRRASSKEYIECRNSYTPIEIKVLLSEYALWEEASNTSSLEPTAISWKTINSPFKSFRNMKNIYIILGLLSLLLIGYTVNKMFNSDKNSSLKVSPEGGELVVAKPEIKTSESTTPIRKRCSIIVPVLINGEIPNRGDINYMRLKRQTTITATMNDGGTFYFPDLLIPENRMFEFEILLKNRSTPISAMTLFVEPDENNISNLNALQFDGQYDKRGEKLTNIIFKPTILNQIINQNGDSNKATQENR